MTFFQINDMAFVSFGSTADLLTIITEFVYLDKIDEAQDLEMNVYGISTKIFELIFLDICNEDSIDQRPPF